MTRFEIGDRVRIHVREADLKKDWDGFTGEIVGLSTDGPEIPPLEDRRDEIAQGGNERVTFYWPWQDLERITTDEKENTEMTFAQDANETLTLWASEIDRKIAQYEADGYDYRVGTAVATLRDWKGQVLRAQERLVETAPELRPDPFVTEVNDILDGFDAGIAAALEELTDAFAGDVRLSGVAAKAAAWRAEIEQARTLVG